MKNYLGETPVNIQETEFRDYTPADWAMYFIESYGQIDEGHHKQWVLDQVARILKGTQVILKRAKWAGGETEWRISLGEPSDAYNQWVAEMNEDDDFDAYDPGIAP